jgi:nitroimidazol reductase NimA-like FMN-containing flavoprotein (pyridoxamine 5'-phosphate oxidase superfamily)
MASAIEVYRTHPTDDEIAAVLEQREIATLGTLNSNGSIHLAYVIFLHVDGRFWLETSSVTRKARNIRDRPTATLLIPGRVRDARTVMVSVEGSARIIEGAEAQERNRRVLAKYATDQALDGLHRAWSRIDDVSIEITPTRTRSWTNTLLRREAEAELGASYGTAWRDDD